MIQRLKSNKFLQIFAIYTRYLIGISFVFASIVKIKGERFYTAIDGIQSSPFHSAGHLFETLYQSGIYWKFLGFAQLFAAFLLMTQRFSRFGAAIFFPIILNIFFITASYADFSGTIYITSLMLLANIFLLIWDFDYVKVVLGISKNQVEEKSVFEKIKVWEWCGLILFVFTAVWRNYVVSFFNLLIWVGVSLLIGLIFLILGLKESKKGLNTIV